MAERAELLVAGQAFVGWKSISVRASIESACGSFQLTASERHPDDVLKRSIRRGDPCEIKLEGDLVLSGFVNTVERQHRATDHAISVSGRSRACDLVDCSVTHEPGEWKSRTILQIARDLAEPYGIEVKAEADIGAAFPTFRVKESETVFNAIERMARQRGLLLISDATGALVLTRASAVREPLAVILGTEVLEASVSDSEADRFSLYRFKAQQQGGDLLLASSAAAPQGEATDPEVTRFRPSVQLAEAQGDDTTLRERARWEAARRAGEAHRPEIVVRQWRNSAGSLWRPNTLVKVVDDFLEIDGELLVVSVNYQSDSSGRRATLSLSRPEAFNPLPIPEKAGKQPELWLTSTI